MQVQRVNSIKTPITGCRRSRGRRGSRWSEAPRASAGDARTVELLPEANVEGCCRRRRSCEYRSLPCQQHQHQGAYSECSRQRRWRHCQPSRARSCGAPHSAAATWGVRSLRGASRSLCAAWAPRSRCTSRPRRRPPTPAPTRAAEARTQMET